MMRVRGPSSMVCWVDGTNLVDDPPVDVEATYHRLLETMAPEARRELGRLLLEAQEPDRRD